jgi:hypothetical protein
VKNLYLAGDFIKNPIDLACMEGAVSAALETAREILGEHGETGAIPIVQAPPEWPRALLVAARVLLIPVVAVARIMSWFEETFSPHRPYASNVRVKATPKLQKDSRPPRKR